MDINLAGEQVTLLPERAIYWPRKKTVFVTDLHWGKAESFWSASIAVPSMVSNDLNQLTALLEKTLADRIVILGDLLHGRESLTPMLMEQVAEWRQKHRVAIELVPGNHDRHAGRLPTDWEIHELDPFTIEEPFLLTHMPTKDDDLYTLAGHLHPAVTLRGMGRQKEVLRCFWVQPRLTILPAFGIFTGKASVVPQRGEQIYLVLEDQVIPCPQRQPLQN